MKNFIALIRFVLLSLAVLVLINCKQKTSNDASQVDNAREVQDNISKSSNKFFKTLNKGSFSIDYPAKWELDASGANHTSFIAMHPKTSPQDKFRENINLMVNDVSGFNYTLDRFVKIAERQVNEIYLNPTVIRSERKQDDQGEFHEIEYLGDLNNVRVQYIQRYRLKNDKSYILSYAAEPNEFDLYKKVAMQSLESFKIKS